MAERERERTQGLDLPEPVVGPEKGERFQAEPEHTTLSLSQIAIFREGTVGVYTSTESNPSVVFFHL